MVVDMNEVQMSLPNGLLLFKSNSMIGPFKLHSCLRPYHGEITGSRLISKVKHRRAWVVLGWVTTWEVRVL